MPGLSPPPGSSGGFRRLPVLRVRGTEGAARNALRLHLRVCDRARRLRFGNLGMERAAAARGERESDLARRGLGRALVARGNWFPDAILCPRDGYANPFGVEGFKTIAFEIVEQLGGKAPDRVYAPVGSGDGFYGVWKGFVELHKAGVLDRLPRMVACQASGANPYVRAFRRGDRTLQAVASALNSRTLDRGKDRRRRCIARRL